MKLKILALGVAMMSGTALMAAPAFAEPHGGGGDWHGGGGGGWHGAAVGTGVVATGTMKAGSTAATTGIGIRAMARPTAIMGRRPCIMWRRRRPFMCAPPRGLS